MSVMRIARTMSLLLALSLAWPAPVSAAEGDTATSTAVQQAGSNLVAALNLGLGTTGFDINNLTPEQQAQLLAMVQANPALAQMFATTGSTIGGQQAGATQTVTAEQITAALSGGTVTPAALLGTLVRSAVDSSGATDAATGVAAVVRAATRANPDLATSIAVAVSAQYNTPEVRAAAASAAASAASALRPAQAATIATQMIQALGSEVAPHVVVAATSSATNTSPALAGEIATGMYSALSAMNATMATNLLPEMAAAASAAAQARGTNAVNDIASKLGVVLGRDTGAIGLMVAAATQAAGVEAGSPAYDQAINSAAASSGVDAGTLAQEVVTAAVIVNDRISATMAAVVTTVASLDSVGTATQQPTTPLPAAANATTQEPTDNATNGTADNDELPANGTDDLIAEEEPEPVDSPS
ncbi:MAG: hypothetical protein H7831_03335 [Magnetococcus sp. WYHC-3]